MAAAGMIGTILEGYGALVVKGGEQVNWLELSVPTRQTRRPIDLLGSRPTKRAQFWQANGHFRHAKEGSKFSKGALRAVWDGTALQLAFPGVAVHGVAATTCVAAHSSSSQKATRAAAALSIAPAPTDAATELRAA